MYMKCSECANCRAYNLFGGIKSSFPVIYDSHNGPKFTKKKNLMINTIINHIFCSFNVYKNDIKKGLVWMVKKKVFLFKKKKRV